MNLFNICKPVIGMIHLSALPGTPKYEGSVKAVIDKAIKEAEIYISAGIDVLMIENMHDVPYLNREACPEITSVMSIILYELKNRFNVPLGIQILAGANKEALSAAHASGADFIRGEGYVFAHIADEGIFNSDAGKLMRFRKQIGADNILVFTDIKKKHSSHSITADTNISETAKAAEYFLSDGVIITGSATGEEPSLNEIKDVKECVGIPVIAGSGITINNVTEYLKCCDALIVGSYFKEKGVWYNRIDKEKVKSFMDKVKKLRNA